jgi:alpha-galactosidase
MLRAALFLVFGYTLLLPNDLQAQPLQIYILAGQSNMQGHAHVRTFEHLAMDQASKPLLEKMLNPDGSHHVCDRIWISSIGCADNEQIGKLTTGFGASQNGPKIGPEFTFGLTIQEYVPGKILLIKTSWGGKSLNTDFRPPSAGPYVFNAEQLKSIEKNGKDLRTAQAEKDVATGVSYRQMIDHVKKVLSDLPRVVPDYDASQGYELAGFVWFQGWNDMVDSSTYPHRDKPDGYRAYSDVMAHFIRDVRKDLTAPHLPFVIGVLGVGGPTELYAPEQLRYKAIHDNFRNAMAAPASLPEFEGNVAYLRTEKFWDNELSDAKQKEDRIKNAAQKKAKAESLSPDAERKLVETMLAEGMTDRERNIVAKGISNFEFHYLGSAKILGGIGEGLAHTMAQIKKLKK